MWEGYENALKLYFNKAVKLWVAKGYKNNMKFEVIEGKIILPKWFGNEEFHVSPPSPNLILWSVVLIKGSFCGTAVG